MPHFDKSQIRRLTFGLLLGLVLPALDQSIVITALNVIGRDLGDSRLQWLIISAYLIPVLVTGPLYGKLSDVFGRKILYVTSVSIFTAGSALCGLAWSMPSLTSFRVLQGLGGGGVVVLTLAFLADALEGQKRALYESLFAGVFVLGGIAGPVVGGLFAERGTILKLSGWRWIFEINVPFGLLAIFLVASLPVVDRKAGMRRIDWIGAGCLVLWLVPLLLAIDNRSGGKTPLSADVYLTISLLGLMCFVVAEIRAASDAIIPLGLFLNREFSSIGGILFFTSCTRGGTDVVIPLILQLIDGLSPAEAGIAVLPQVAATTFGSIVASRLIGKNGRYKYPAAFGIILTIASLFAMPFTNWNAVPFAPILFVYGLGAGLMQTLPWAMQNAAAVEKLGVASSASSLFSRLGAIIGSALFFNLIFSNLELTKSDMFCRQALQYRPTLAQPAFQQRVDLKWQSAKDATCGVPLRWGPTNSQAEVSARARYVIWAAALMNALSLYLCRYLPAAALMPFERVRS